MNRNIYVTFGLYRLLAVLITALFFTCSVSAQSSSSSSSSSSSAQSTCTPGSIKPEYIENSLLYDRNGDGQLVVLGFGDSITRGVGDFIQPNQFADSVESPIGEAGYPLRVETVGGISVINGGKPGERLTEALPRLVNMLNRYNPDIVIFAEGTNDAEDQEHDTRFFNYYQIAVNLISAYGAEPIIMTLVPSTEESSGALFFIQAFNFNIRRIANYNQLHMVDAYSAFDNTCLLGSCDLLVRPEGLHPNKKGYDVLGENVLATLLGINLLTPDSAAILEDALCLPVGSIKTVPSPAAP